jgi:hypothetical protein
MRREEFRSETIDQRGPQDHAPHERRIPRIPRVRRKVERHRRGDALRLGVREHRRRGIVDDTARAGPCGQRQQQRRRGALQRRWRHPGSVVQQVNG